MFGVDLNPTQIADLATRLSTALATAGQSELLRLAADLGDDLIAEITADLPAPVREALQTGFLAGFDA